MKTIYEQTNSLGTTITVVENLAQGGFIVRTSNSNIVSYHEHKANALARAQAMTA